MPNAAAPAPPTVSIVLLVGDGWEATCRCLMSLPEGSAGVSCERIVLDNASADETRLAVPRLEGVVAARSEETVGRARALAAGARIARGRHLLFLSQDAELRPGSLAPLVAALEADPSLAAVGPSILGPGGAVEAAGLGVARAAPLPITPFPLDHGEAPLSVRGGPVPALPGACLLVRAQAFRDAGGFDQGYQGGFEDVDLCFRLAQRGGRLALVPSSAVVLHAPPDWEDLGRHGEDVHRLNRAWAGRFTDFTVGGAMPAPRAAGVAVPADPRDEFIARVVRGQSFVDVGGLWGTVNEKVSVAHGAGAIERAMLDVTPEGGELWRLFRERMRALGIGEVSCGVADIAEYQGRRYDVVHCSGVLYHHPNPLLLLTGLRRICGGHLVLTSAIAHGRIENRAGSLEVPPASAIFIPALSDRERAILAEHWRAVGAGALGITQPASYAIDESNATDMGPWWWLLTAEAMRALCEVAGFEVLEGRHSWGGNAYTVLARLQTAPVRANAPRSGG